jgi:hypothetical protein
MKHLYILILFTTPLFSQTPVLEYTFASDAQGWTANNGSNNFTYNSANGGEIMQNYTDSNTNPQLKSPASLNLDTTTLNYLIITVKNSNASNNKFQFVPNMTNTSNNGAAYDSFLSSPTIADNNEYVTVVVNLLQYAEETFGTNGSKDKWSGTLNSFKIAVKPQNPAVEGTFHIAYFAFYTEKPTLGEFNYVGSGYDGLWNRKQNVTIAASAGNLNVTAVANQYAKLTLDENVRISGTTPHMYVTLVNNTIDNQLRILGTNDNANVFLNQTMSGTNEEQTLYFNLEAESSKNGVSTPIAKDSDGHYQDIALSFRSTETGFGGKSKGGLYEIKSINFYPQPLSVEDLNLLDNIQVYPNPAQDFVFIDNANIDDNVNVFNVVGKRVMSFKIETENQQVDIKDLKSGLYFLRLNKGQATKLLKK